MQLCFVKQSLANVSECRSKGQTVCFIAEFSIERNFSRSYSRSNVPIIFRSAVIQYNFCCSSPNFCVARICLNCVFVICALLFVSEVCCRASGSRSRSRSGIANNCPVTNVIGFREIGFLQLHVGCVRKMAKITLRESFHRTSLKQHHLDSLRFE